MSNSMPQPESIPSKAESLAGSDRAPQHAAQVHLQRWLLSDELRQYLLESEDIRHRPSRTGPYIAISRDAGAGGGKIAGLVGQLLGWDVLDKELLDIITQRYSIPRERLDSVDETQSDWFHDIFGGWFDRTAVAAEDYVFHLEKVIYLAAIHGRVVIVGRGAHCLLPRDSGLSARIVAPFAWRVDRLMREQQLDERQARHVIESQDIGRRELCKYYFQQESFEPCRFDIVLNAERFSPESISRQIVAAFRERFPNR